MLVGDLLGELLKFERPRLKVFTAFYGEMILYRGGGYPQVTHGAGRPPNGYFFTNAVFFQSLTLKLKY